MFKWLSTKFFGSELNHDLEGLRSLPLLERLKTVVVIVQRIQNGMDFLDQGKSLTEVQSGYQEIRRQAVAQATGYNDPTHLVASLPELFFVSLSDKYDDKDGVSIRRSISDALLSIFKNDAWGFLKGNEAQELVDMYTALQRRLVEHKFI